MRILLLLLGIGLAHPALADTWPTKAHDARRTGQSAVTGPLALDDERSWSAEALAAGKVNVGATVTDRGVVVGSWGLQRRDPRGPLFWDKADGKLYAYDLRRGRTLWGGPLALDLTPRCYDYDDRGPDLLWCGFGRLQVSHYNGTVEGQPTYDAARDRLYVGRGDGKLYAVEASASRIGWRFETFNPDDRNDPDGGGEIVASPLLGPNGFVYVATWGEGPYETNAVYAVRPDGSLAWRWPHDRSLAHRFYASPALSPDGGTFYASTFVDETPHTAASLYAFRTSARARQPHRWEMALTHGGSPVFTTTLAVGADGVIYVGGYIVRGGRSISVVAAVRDRGDRRPPAYVWGERWIEVPSPAQFVHGIGLREENGATTRLYVTTANQGTPLLNGLEAGELVAVEPGTGEILAVYDPSDDDPTAVGSLTAPAIGANGTVYVGVRGRFGPRGVDGHVLALDYDEAARRFGLRWRYVVDGHIEWNHPAIGPDGGLYISSTPNTYDGNNLRVFDLGTVPEGTTATVYGLKGPE